jgi:hypothetical protein
LPQTESPSVGNNNTVYIVQNLGRADDSSSVITTGIVVSGIVLIIAIISIALVLYKKNKNMRKKKL